MFFTYFALLALQKACMKSDTIGVIVKDGHKYWLVIFTHVPKNIVNEVFWNTYSVGTEGWKFANFFKSYASETLVAEGKVDVIESIYMDLLGPYIGIGIYDAIPEGEPFVLPKKSKMKKFYGNLKTQFFGIKAKVVLSNQ